MNLLSIAIVTGYQEQVKNKVMGFISPIFISKIDPEQIGIDPSQKRTSIFESEPIPMDTMLANQVRGFENVASVEAVIYRPALLYSKKILENVLQYWLFGLRRQNYFL
ncbi:MAG: hypothetical protein EB076_09240 [Flavobacteriia bacterium]|nr:hypothetical protein [Flavobacteriia bacterium]